MTFEKLFEQHNKFAARVYPDTTETACLHHTIEEICEIWKETKDYNKPEEYVDAFLCLLTGMQKAGINLQVFSLALQMKINKNESRTWKKNADDSYSHT